MIPLRSGAPRPSQAADREPHAAARCDEREEQDWYGHDRERAFPAAIVKSAARKDGWDHYRVEQDDQGELADGHWRRPVPRTDTDTEEDY